MLTGPLRRSGSTSSSLTRVVIPGHLPLCIARRGRGARVATPRGPSVPTSGASPCRMAGPCDPPFRVRLACRVRPALPSESTRCCTEIKLDVDGFRALQLNDPRGGRGSSVYQFDGSAPARPPSENPRPLRPTRSPNRPPPPPLLAPPTVGGRS